MAKKLEVNDGRYDINLEFTGATTQQHVVRFCGDFVSAHDGRGQAEIAALEHCIARDKNRSGWELVAKVQNVLWLVKGAQHRVAYGADITDCTKNQASEQFAACVNHALECEGLI